MTLRKIVAVVAPAVLGVSAVWGPAAANGAVVLTLVPGPGVNPAAVPVGRTFELDVRAQSTDPTEVLTGATAGLQFAGPNGAGLTPLSIVFAPSSGTLLVANPIVFQVQFQASVIGASSPIVDFSTGSNFLSTNLATYRINTTPLTVTAVAVPEPATLGTAALTVVATLGRRRRCRA